eukprot:15218619-Alexandrium_andersonii.AAC.1
MRLATALQHVAHQQGHPALGRHADIPFDLLLGLPQQPLVLHEGVLDVAVHRDLCLARHALQNEDARAKHRLVVGQLALEELDY